MLNCELCKQLSVVPIQLFCNHLFCFLCLEEKILENKKDQCPSCLGLLNFKTVVNISSENYIWLYSSNCNDKWWCYNKIQNLKIENIYKDYTMRQNLLKKDDEIDDFKIKIPKFGKKSKPVINSDELYESIDIQNDSSSICVNFGDYSNIKKVSDEICSQNSYPLSYILEIGEFDYKIDFDNMKQINMIDTWRKRSIKRVEVPTDTKNLTNFLKDKFDIVGVAGQKF
jgi:hypothetical protein